MSDKCVLLADGDRFFADIYRRHLQEAGFEVVHAAHGEEVAPLIEKHRPDLILLEIALPWKDGFQLLDELKEAENTKGIPVAIFTDIGGKEDVDRCLKAGADYYILKSQHRPEEVVARVRRLLGMDA